VVTIERHERRHLHPSVTQLFVSVSVKATCVRSNERNLEELELEDTLNIKVHVLPFAEIVAEPVASPFTGAGECRTGNDERTLSRDDGLKSFVRSLLFHQPPNIMNIKLNVTTSVCSIRRDSIIGEAPETYSRLY
jgi:hypothetical protein